MNTQPAARNTTTRNTLDMHHLEMAYDQQDRRFPAWLRGGNGPVDRSLARLQAAGLLDQSMACTHAGSAIVLKRRGQN
jgi:hypothetical protein